VDDTQEIDKQKSRVGKSTGETAIIEDARENKRKAAVVHSTLFLWIDPDLHLT